MELQESDADPTSPGNKTLAKSLHGGKGRCTVVSLGSRLLAVIKKQSHRLHLFPKRENITGSSDKYFERARAACI